MQRNSSASEVISKKLSVIENKEIYFAEGDSFSEDEKYGEYKVKQKQEVLKKVQELFHDDDFTHKQSDETMFVLNENQKQEIFEELEEEFGQSYNEAKVKQNTYIKLIPMNELQLAYIYTDKFPLLHLRKKILIGMKSISSWAAVITTHPVFEIVTLIVIVFNSIMLAYDDPTTNVQTSFQDLTDIVFLVYYSVEAVLKIIAQGFIFPKKAYLRDTWNILDFAVIITAYIPYFLASNSVNLNALRSFRVLRPLRTVSSIKALRTILLALFASIAQLRDAVIILIFFYSIFAIGGVQLFSGYLKRRCIGEQNGIAWIPDNDETLFCISDSDCPFASETIYNENFVCGKQIANPNEDLITFDTFGWSFLQVFVITTLEGWTTIQQAVELTFSPFAVLYFMIIVLIGAFFLVNLTLAIIKLNFKPEKIQEELALIKEEIEEYDYIQLTQLKLYNPNKQQVATEGFGTTWDKHNTIDQQLLLNKKRKNQNDNQVVNLGKKKGKNRVTFQPIKSAIYYSHPTILKTNKIKIQGIYGVGNQKQLNQQLQQNNNHNVNNTNTRSSMMKRGSQSSNNDQGDKLSQNSKSHHRESQHRESQHKESSHKDSHLEHLHESGSLSKQQQKSLRKSIQLADPQLSSDIFNSPMIIDFLPENITRPLNSGTMLVQHRGSMESSKSGEDKTPHNKLEIPKLGEIKQHSQNVKSSNNNQKFQMAMKYGKPPRNSPKPDSQKSFDDDEFNSVNLSELNTLSDDEIDVRLEEMGILNDEKIEVTTTEGKNLNIQEKLKKMENKKQKEQKQSNLDEASLKLKSKLYQIQFYPIIIVDSILESEDDVLVSKVLKLLQEEKRKKIEQIKKKKFHIQFFFKNQKQSLELKKSGSKSKNMTKSGYLKSNLKSRKNNLSLRRIQPINDELHPYEDYQLPSEKFGEKEDEELNSENSGSENEQGQDVDNKKDKKEGSGGINGSMNQKTKQKRKKKEQQNQEDETLNYEQLMQKFIDESDCIVDLGRIKEVQKEKEFTPQELAALRSYEIEQQKGAFYQEYNDLKTKDLEEIDGNITAQASIEDVLLIADYTFFDSKFARQMNIVMKAINYKKRETYIYLQGIIGFLKVVQNHMLYIVESQYFDALMNIAVTFNTVILALDGLVSDDTSTLFNQFNLAFTILFTIELGMKLLGMGMKNYLADIMNIFDATIVVLSLVELFFFGGTDTIKTGKKTSKSSLSAFKSVRIFRTFRVLRVTKLMRSLQFMGFLMKVLTNAFQSFMYIMILLILFIFIFVLLGMAFFGGQLTYTSSRQSFDDIQSAFLVVFQVLTLENWNSVLYELLLQDVSPFITVPYLVFWIMIGNYVFLNLFLAILLEKFEEEYKTDKAGLDTDIEIGQDSVDNTTNAINSTSTLRSTLKSKRHNATSALENPNDHDKNKQKQIQIQFYYFTEPGICQYSLFIFGQDNLIRRICYRIVKDGKFETLIFTMIFFTSAKLVFDTYIPQTGQLKEISLDIDIFFAAFFGFEMCMKIIAFGFIYNESSYLRESWNILDFLIVIASFIDVSVSSINLSFVKILRLLRTLRPLRFITHNRSMKILVSALLQSINGIFNVTVVVVLAWMMFAILGISLEKDKLHYCNFDDETVHYNVGDEECLQLGYNWDNYKTNFDNILNGMLTLFILCTMEGWPDYMYLFIDADEAGPIRGAQLQFSWFFVIFILFGSILLMNLFIGVILVNYHLAEEAARDKILTPVQADWIELQKLIVSSNPNLAMYFCPDNPFRAKIFQVIKSKYFDPAILTVIVGNIVTMGLTMDDSDLTYDDVLSQLNTIFTFIFIGEAGCKIIALGPVGYMRNTWNQFDFFVVCASILDLILQFTGSSFISFLSAGPQIIRVFRVLRVTRLFRLIKSLEGLQKLIETAIYSLPAMLNVTALLFLVYFIFAILGVFLFGDLTSGWAIDENNNFTDFHHAFLLLFRCSTGEDWYKFMFDTMEDGQGYYCIYFIIFIMIQQFIMLNLFVLIILDQYEINYFNSDNPLNKFQEYENMFIESWAKFAKEDKGMKMNEKLLVTLLLDMEKPIGYDLKDKIKRDIEEWRRINPQLDNKEEIQKQTIQIKAISKRYVSTQLMKMNIMADLSGQVRYHQILFSVMKAFMWKKVSIDLQPEGAEKILIKEEETLRKLKKKQQGGNWKEVALVNPIVQFLFVSMAFKALHRYGFKKKQQLELLAKLQQEELEQKEHFSDGFSSDSSFDNNVQIQEREIDLEKLKRPDYGKTRYLTLPNTEIYKDEVFINQDVEFDNQNISEESSEDEEDPDEQIMQQNLGSNQNIDQNISANNGGNSRTNKSISQQGRLNGTRKTTLKPQNMIRGLGQQKKTQSSVQESDQKSDSKSLVNNQVESKSIANSYQSKQ